MKQFKCGHITKSGEKCRQTVTLLSKQCAAGHPLSIGFAGSVEGQKKRCSLSVVSTQLICEIHSSEEWQVMVALGAIPPCPLWDPNFMTELIRKGRITDPLLLSTMAESEKDNFQLRRAIAGSPHCPSHVLCRMALPDANRHPQTTEMVLSMRAASNPALDFPGRALVLRDGDHYARAGLCRNPNITDQELIQLSRLHTNLVNKNISRNRKSPREALENIAYSKSPEVQHNLRWHPNHR